MKTSTHRTHSEDHEWDEHEASQNAHFTDSPFELTAEAATTLVCFLLQETG